MSQQNWRLIPSPAASVATRTWACFAKLALGVDARTGRVAVADLHPAVDLRDRQTPLAELAEWPAVLAVAREVVERVLVLGENQQFHLRVGERRRSRSEHLSQLREFRFDLRAFQSACLVNELPSRCDVLAERSRVDRDDLVLQPRDDLLLLLVGQLVEVIGKSIARSAPCGTSPGRPECSRASPSSVRGCGARRRCSMRSGAGASPW